MGSKEERTNKTGADKIQNDECHHRPLMRAAMEDGLPAFSHGTSVALYSVQKILHKVISPVTSAKAACGFPGSSGIIISSPFMEKLASFCMVDCMDILKHKY